MTKKRQKNIALMKRIPWMMIVFFIILCFSTQVDATKVAAKTSKTKTYTVKPGSKPYANQYVKTGQYNKKTKQYYMLRSYLEQMEKNGGGTLVLKKGTYNITNVLYVPSNVTIKLSNGVKINKSMSTGTKKLSAAKSLFQLVPPSKAGKKDSISKYQGSKNVKIIGYGSALINLKYEKDVVGIVIGHNSNVTIQGIDFLNMNSGNFIQIAASKKVTIYNNTFKNHKDSSGNNREAIRLAVADGTTKNFTYKWSKSDSTINKNIYIKKNKFTKLERAIGSTKYAAELYHNNVQITENTIKDLDSDAIRILNWSFPIIKNNTFTDIADGGNSKRAILASGTTNPTITDNTFTKVARTIQILPAKNSGAGKKYAIIYNIISAENKTAMLNNTVKDVEKYYIFYSTTYNGSSDKATRWYYIDYKTKDYEIVNGSPTYRDYFTNYSTYNGYTKDFYVFKSYFEQLERVGGGTLHIKKGTYTITNTLYIPSNVTIYMEDGVVINKGTYTGLSSLPPALSMFQMVPPAKSLTNATIGNYDGGHDINVIGSGKVLIDLKQHYKGLVFVLGHCQNISISGITFENMYEGHFIELNSSKNVTIEGCTFQYHMVTDATYKEAINIDTPDSNTKGFNNIWAKQDCTPVENVYIKNNTFNMLDRAVGTHKYSENSYHKNVQILNNTITDCDNDPIRVLNWDSPVITGNKISNVNYGLGSKRAVLMSGVINPTVTGNIFEQIARPIQIYPWMNTGNGEGYAITYNTITAENINAMLNNTLVNVKESFIRVSEICPKDETDTSTETQAETRYQFSK